MSILGIVSQLGAPISAIGSVVGQAMSNRSQEKQNARAEAFSREMYDKQRNDALTDWNMQNAYNDPSAQMSRLQNANLNPHLVYGNGADAQMGAPVRQSQAQTPSFKASQYDFGSVVQNALASQQMQANIAKTQAETERINQDSMYKKFENDIRDAIGLDKYRAVQSDKLDLQETSQKKSLLEVEAWNHVVGQSPVSDLTNPLSKKIVADFETASVRLDNFKKDFDIKSAIQVVKNFEAGLAKAGISPNSPWYVKFVDKLIEKISGSSAINLLK